MSKVFHPLALLRLLLATAIVVQFGCASVGEALDYTSNWTDREFYEAARNALTDENYEIAIRYYEELESRYPFGAYAKQAQIEAAYAYYKYNEPDSALSAANRFLRMNPSHDNVDYAIYLKGLINFNRGVGFLDKYLSPDPADLDPGAARQAFFDFEQLVTRFPDSAYTADASQRMRYLRNNLARHEVNVADYNMRRGAYVAAARRASTVIESYSGAPAVGDALALLAKAYLALEIRDLSTDALRVLMLNFPQHNDIPTLRTQLGI